MCENNAVTYTPSTTDETEFIIHSQDETPYEINANYSLTIKSSK